MSSSTGRHRVAGERGDGRVDARSDDRIEELRRDHRHEVGMLWRGLVAFGIVLCVVWLRQRYFV